MFSESEELWRPNELEIMHALEKLALENDNRDPGIPTAKVSITL
jgi:hypothetical protein